MSKYREYKQLDLPTIAKEELQRWEQEKTFEQSVNSREGRPAFTFYEGPPSANGLPGIHHVMARAIKDIFCRYKTLKGFQVKRKGGWDTHGLPVELSVEKTLGIRKDDIGKTISIEDYNKACRKEVMKYKNVWDDLTRKMGYWVDLEHPYVTFENNYIETCWYLLQQFYKKGLLYKGYTIQPYSPAAGTGLSSHELNQPGTYRMVKDTSCTAMFRVSIEDAKRLFSNIPELEIYSKELNRLGLKHNIWESIYMLAWTTTPWTLPANTALAVGENVEYFLGGTINPYTKQPNYVILAKDRFINYFPTAEWAAAKAASHAASAASKSDPIKDVTAVVEMAALAESLSKNPIPIIIFKSFKGSELSGIRYTPLFDDLEIVQSCAKHPETFQVVVGDFVNTEDGTGIVHISPTFGADDKRVADKYGISGVYVEIIEERRSYFSPIVDRQGKYVDQMGEWAGRYVKNYTDDPNYVSLDVDLCVHLKQRGLAFRVEKYEHSYPHCWRTDKPILYYPLDSWFIKTTAMKDRLIALNKTINWKPESTGTGRFGNWLENLVDWNLSRSRFWGIPLPVWRTEDVREEKCIGSIDELKKEIAKAIAAGFMDKSHLEHVDAAKSDFDLHRPYVDHIVLASESGKKMMREPDLIDVWFDSGAMPYAQYHYMGDPHSLPFGEGRGGAAFPADFIAEGVDQTRGWFFTLHAIAGMLFDSVAFKNVVSNGLVLDKNGNKMSKRLGNAADPFETIDKYGADATRWYMISNAQPWDNLKFNLDGITEVQRKFFGTLYNTYAFFALYANIDGFIYKEEEIPVKERPEIDRWILSELNSLIKLVDECYDDYEPTKACRAIQDFVTEHLSNWYVRLCRRRFWKGDYTQDKIAAYQTLYTCLEIVSQLMSPVAPFFADRLFTDLNNITHRSKHSSVHFSDFPKSNASLIDKLLEERMELAQKISSMVLSLRKKVNIRVRQPLNKILLPVLDNTFQSKVESVKDLILAEVNVKEIHYITDTAGILVKKIKPNFKVLGKKVGGLMKDVAAAIGTFTQEDILKFESDGKFELKVKDQMLALEPEDVEILSEDIPGWQVASEDKLTVALDIKIDEKLKEEGIAREFINRIQNIRKDKGFEVTDKIDLKVQNHTSIKTSILNNKEYICAEILATSLDFTDNIPAEDAVPVEVDEDTITMIKINKHE